MNRKLTTDVLVNFLIKIGIRGRGVVFIPLITGVLGIEAFGAYTQVTAVSSVLQLLFGFGLHSGLIRFGQEDRFETGELYYTLVLFSLAGGLVAYLPIFIFSGEVSQLLLRTDQYATAFRFGTILVLTRIVLKMQRSYFRTSTRNKTATLIEGLSAYMSIAGVVFALLFVERSVTALVLSIVLTDTIFIFIVQGYISTEVGLVLPTTQGLSDIFEFSLPISIAMLADSAASKADRLLIGVFVSASAVGIYSVAYQIAIVISVLFIPITETFFPKFSKLIENDDWDTCTNLLRQGSRYFLLVAVPAVGGLFLTNQEISDLLVQSGDGAPSSTITAIVAAGILLFGMNRIYSILLSADKQNFRLMLIRIVGAASNISLNVILIPHYGIAGAALATLLTYSLTTALVYILVSDLTPDIFPTRSVVTFVLSTIVMVAVISATGLNGLLFTVVAGVVFYFCLLFFVQEITYSEVTNLVTQ